MERISVFFPRGARIWFPESTAVSFRVALEMGADLEFDLQRTKDGHIVIKHDNTLQQTTNGSGFIYDKTLKELKELDAGS